MESRQLFIFASGVSKLRPMPASQDVLLCAFVLRVSEVRPWIDVYCGLPLRRSARTATVCFKLGANCFGLSSPTYVAG